MKKTLGFVLLVIATKAFAADTAAKEEITPPPAEGAFTAEQIPPLSSIETKKLPAAPPPRQAPVGMPQQPGGFVTQPPTQGPVTQPESPPMQPTETVPIQPESPSTPSTAPVAPAIQPTPPAGARLSPVAPSMPARQMSSSPPVETSLRQSESDSLSQHPLSFAPQSLGAGGHISDKVPETEILN